MPATNIVETLAVIASLELEEGADKVESNQTNSTKNEDGLSKVAPPAAKAAEELETSVVRRFLCPSAHKLYDFRKEEGFEALSSQTLAEKRTLLEHNRLLTLFHSVRNTQNLSGAVAEIGSYKGGSAKFIARTFAHFGFKPPIHVFDTFTGHPDQLIETLDGEHTTPGLFSDTDAESVRSYLSDFENIQIHVGTIEERCSAVADEQFALVHIDVDIYSATVTCLNFFSPRIVGGGIFVIDDYGFSTCIGVKQAIDYFLTVNHEYTGWYLHTGQFVLQKKAAVSAEKSSDDHMQELLKYNTMTARLLEQQQMIQGLQAQLVTANVAANLATSRVAGFKQLAEKLSSSIISKNAQLDEYGKLRKAIDTRSWLRWIVNRVNR